MKFPPCHENSPLYPKWIERVEQLEEMGLSTSDSQAIADLEFSNHPEK
jgi:hypothetical protein